MTAWGLVLSLFFPFFLAQSIRPPQAPAPRERDLVLEPEPVQQPAASALRVPRGYALIVGVGRYKNLDESRQLQFAESDAEAVYRVLISQQGGAFPPENVHVLKGAQATVANIQREVEQWLPSVAQPEDRVIVFFAVHGVMRNGRGYLAASDLDPARVENTAYPMAALGDVMANRVKARWKVLLADACKSGKINAETTDESIDRQLQGLPRNFLTFTATTERERSFEDAKLSTGFGIFTYFLVQAWTGNADNDPCDGRITADELIDYVRTNVRRYAKDRQLSQTPTAYGDYDPAMLLGAANACLSTNASTPSLLGTAIVETNLDDVELYIDDALIGTLSKGKPLTVPRLASGTHEFKGVKSGYEPDRKTILIAPGQDVTVTLRITYRRQIKKAALDFNADGEKLLQRRRSTLNPVNIVAPARAQTDADLAKARDLFSKALGEDGAFVTAAINLGQTLQLLGDEKGSLVAYRRALAADPSDVNARNLYAAVLIESGDPDEAIRQLTEALRLAPESDETNGFLARAYWDKGVWDRCIEAADRTIRLNPSNAQAHLWRADAQRQLAAGSSDDTRRQELFKFAREDYRAFLDLTNISTPLYETLAFRFVGFHLGSRRHADRKESWDNLRAAGFLGLCITEMRVGNRLRAREYCTRAVGYQPGNPISYFLLGNVNRDLYNQFSSCEYLAAARSNYRRLVALNEELDEAKHARNYLTQIEQIIPKTGCRIS